MTNEIRREQMQKVAAGVRTGVSNKLGNIWWFLVLRGVFALALGVYALFWPDQNLSTLVLAVGIYCVADGATELVAAVRQPEILEHLARGLIVIGIGAVLIWWPGATLRTLLVLLGVATIFAGIGQILAARRLRVDDAEKTTTMTTGIVASVIGLVLVFWPGSGIAVISWVVGIAAILIGALLIFLGSRSKRLRKRIDSVDN